MVKQTVLCDITKCTGCAACSSVCPQQAIKMIVNTEGFLYPEINLQKCTHCELCEKSCPALGKAFSPKGFTEPKTFAAYASSDIRKQSSSGGIFRLLALDVLSQGGYVCGAAFDAKWQLKHTLINNKKDLLRLQGSKYLQSEIENVYQEIKRILVKGKLLLFVGTPCQVAGLYAYLQKDYDNLLTVDLICHGVPSPQVFAEYLREIAGPKKIKSINFRDKANSWDKFRFTIEMQNSKYSCSVHEDVYFQGFDNLFLRKSCYYCSYTRLQRIGDISLGDFWQVNNFRKKWNDHKGISKVLINTPKGEDSWRRIQKELVLNKKIPLKILRYEAMLSRPVPLHKNREKFFTDLVKNKTNTSISELIKLALGKKDVGILNFSYENKNYGANLLGYAMSKLLIRFGYNPIILDFVPKYYAERKPSVFEDFRQKFFNRTEVCYSVHQLKKVTTKLSKIIVAGDQTLRIHYSYKYLLYWAKGLKSLLMYSSSLGSTVLRDPVPKMFQKCLQRFDVISVREQSTANILCELGIKSEVTLDIALLLKAEDYQPIIDSDSLFDSCSLPKEYVAYAFFYKDVLSEMHKPEIMSDLKRKYPFIDVMYDESGNYRSLGVWLNYIKNAKYVITNSFHGMVFSIIFNKQVIVVESAGKLKGLNDRVTFLFRLLGINQNRLVPDLKNVTLESFSKNIEYQSVNKQLDILRKKSLDFLNKSLKIVPKYKKPLRLSFRALIFTWREQFTKYIKTENGYLVKKIHKKLRPKFWWV